MLETSRLMLSKEPREAALEILQAGAASGQTVWMQIQGKSMRPTLRPEDRVEVEAVVPSALRIGDIVVLDSGEKGWVIHRFFGWRRGHLLPRTKGDARLCFDPFWPAARLVGRVRTVERGTRRWACGRLWLLCGTLRSVVVWLRAKCKRTLSQEGTDP